MDKGEGYMTLCNSDDSLTIFWDTKTILQFTKMDYRVLSLVKELTNNYVCSCGLTPSPGLFAMHSASCGSNRCFPGLKQALLH